ncbi:MAG TPA: FmdB family zinc ribbon protein [Opitutaceae bacterium]|nr:FmdB family zinc ribbon protein [Opitutaceae bacterium]
MPTYEYVCLKCGKEFELFQSMKDEPLKICTCGKKGRVRRKIGGGAGLIFKGSGFYATDYKKSSGMKPTPPKASPKEGAKSDGSEKSSSSSANGEKKTPPAQKAD